MGDAASPSGFDSDDEDPDGTIAAGVAWAREQALTAAAFAGGKRKRGETPAGGASSKK